jgi:hypothetical protein
MGMGRPCPHVTTHLDRTIAHVHAATGHCTPPSSRPPVARRGVGAAQCCRLAAPPSESQRTRAPLSAADSDSLARPFIAPSALAQAVAPVPPPGRAAALAAERTARRLPESSRGRMPRRKARSRRPRSAAWGRQLGQTILFFQ